MNSLQEIEQAIIQLPKPELRILRGWFDEFEAEMWDRGWTKVYETFPMETFDEAYVDRVAARLAQVIVFLQPMLDEVMSSTERLRTNQ